MRWRVRFFFPTKLQKRKGCMSALDDNLTRNQPRVDDNEPPVIESEAEEPTVDILKIDASRWNSDNVAEYLVYICFSKSKHVPKLLHIGSPRTGHFQNNPLIPCVFIHPVSGMCTKEILLYLQTLMFVGEYSERAKSAFAEHIAQEELEKIARNLERIEQYSKPQKPFKIQKRSMFGVRETPSVNPKCAFEALIRMMRDTTSFSKCELYLDPAAIQRDFLDVFNIYDYAPPKTVADGVLLNQLANKFSGIGGEAGEQSYESAIFVKSVAMHAWLHAVKTRGVNGVVIGWYEGDIAAVENDPYGIPLTGGACGVQLNAGARSGILCAVLSDGPQPLGEFAVHDSRVILALGKVGA